MGSNSVEEYSRVLEQLMSYRNIPRDLIDSLRSYTLIISRSEEQNRFSEPMLWIGIYIALASLLCTVAMVADLLHGLRNRKFWFPCKYFTLNAASLSVIAVAMKLPVDLNNSMPGMVDQAAKLGSMSFMCTMMANLLPSLATTDNKDLVTNMIALGVLIITLLVNVCIQIKTGVVSYTEFHSFTKNTYVAMDAGRYNRSVAISYVAMLFFLLIILISSALTILTSKQILESKYQTGHETALENQLLQLPGVLTVKKLKQHVRKYWIMAGTGSPEFVTACSATSSASGVICVFSTFIHVGIMLSTYVSLRDYDSDYKWSTVMILITQFTGVVLGTIAPFSRCYAALGFKLSIKWIWNRIKVFKVESYWTQTLSDLKQSGIPLPFGSRKCKIVVHNLNIIILSFCVGFQKKIVVACKIIGLIPIFFLICVLYCFHCWKWLKGRFISSDIVLVKNPEQHNTKKDLSCYVLQLQEDMELAERTLAVISNSVDHLIHKAKKQQPLNLMKLLEGSRGFEGVEKCDSHLVPPLLSKEPPVCWSLTVITLTSIAISLPNIQHDIVDNLLSSVNESIAYMTLVEESLNTKNDHVSVQKAAKTLWLEVEVCRKWLGCRLQKLAPQVSTAGEILQWFKDTAKIIVMEVNATEENSFGRCISANSMYRITETILLYYQEEIHHVTEGQLFAQLSSMIADILAACLTNLPRVIAMICHTSAIEKREVSVHAAAQLLGETMQIINNLEDRELPSLDPDEMAFIDKWCSYLRHLSP